MSPPVLSPGPDPRADTPAPAAPAFPRRTGWRRLWHAGGHTWAGLRAAARHEAAFRQELVVGIPLVGVAWWAAPGRWEALALTGSIVLVWLAELLNSGLEALADAVTLQAHPLIGRAKDMGSAAVGVALALAALTWGVVFWPA